MSPVWPSAEAVARAIVVAARLEDEDPVLTIEGAQAMRGRVYAFVALAHAFPTAPRGRLAIHVGARAETAAKFVSNVRNIIRGKTGQKWFDLDRLNTVCSGLVWPKMTHFDAEQATFAPPPEPGLTEKIAAVPLVPVEPILADPTPPAAAPETIADRVAAVERMKTWKAETPRPEPDPTPKSQLPALIPSKAARDLAEFVRARNAPPERSPVVVEGYLMGEPPFERSALYERLKETGGNVERVAEMRAADEVYVEGWMMAEAEKRNDARARDQEGENV